MCLCVCAVTGRPVSAEEALGMGLVNRVVPTGTARREAEALAASIAALCVCACVYVRVYLRAIQVVFCACECHSRLRWRPRPSTQCVSIVVLPWSPRVLAFVVGVARSYV